MIARLLTVGHTVTVAAVGALKVPSLALICVVPTVVAVDDAVTFPLFSPTEATDASVDVHKHCPVTLEVFPLSNVPVATIWNDWPGVRGKLVGPMVIPVSFGFGKKPVQLSARAKVARAAKAPIRRSFWFVDDIVIWDSLGRALLKIVAEEDSGPSA